jgi:hypothetical protein
MLRFLFAVCNEIVFVDKERGDRNGTDRNQAKTDESGQFVG